MMIAQLMIAGATMLALAADAPKTAPPAAAAAGAAEGKAPPKRVHRDLDDHEGNRLSFDVDEAGTVSNVKAKDRRGNPLNVVAREMKDVSVCVARVPGKPDGAGAKKGAKDATPLCQPLSFMTSDALFKMGTASCWCRVTATGGLSCYGTTCQ